jgi:hypothetical protein
MTACSSSARVSCDRRRGAQGKNGASTDLSSRAERSRSARDLTMTATWWMGIPAGTVEGTSDRASRQEPRRIVFGLSLILGGLFFARRMRAFEFTTLIDPFEARFGKRWATVLLVPALLGEIFWSAELLVAIGSTFGVMLGMELTTAILLSAIIVTFYTMLGGMWSVAYTDAFQLGLVALGMLVALPVVFQATGGLASAWAAYGAARPAGTGLLPPFHAGAEGWTLPTIVNWWDVSLMLMLGGIPWNCYFQRVLSCQTPARAQQHSVFSGLLTIAFTVPPLLLGVAAFGYAWPVDLLAELRAHPAETLPMIFQHITPAWIGLLGLLAIIGAVTSSFSASILSAASMFAWNCCYRLWQSDAAPALAPDPPGHRHPGRRRHGHGAQGAERPGALVLHKRSDLRAARAAARLRALRSTGEPDRLDRGVRRLARPAARRRGTTVRRAAAHSLSRAAGFGPAWFFGRLVRSRDRRAALPARAWRRWPA